MTSALITPSSLTEIMSPPASDFKILDASFVMPGTPVSARDSFLQKHIPGAAFFDIDEVADKNTNLPHMLPPTELFEAEMARLGIKNDTQVIIYGQSGIVMGPARAWWTFRFFGHDNVCILDGGLPAWEASGLPLTADQTTPALRTSYKAYRRTELVRDLTAVQKEYSQTMILDARPAERFSGQAAEPRPSLRSGHIPGSTNFPCMQLVDPATGTLKPKTELKEIFEGIGYKPGQKVITTCGSGVTACVIALALYELGYPDVPVYDGSWSEWGMPESGTPVETA